MRRLSLILADEQGGIIQLVQITISDLVSLKDRGKYAGIMCVASIAVAADDTAG